MPIYLVRLLLSVVCLLRPEGVHLSLQPVAARVTGADEYTHTLVKETLRQCDSNPDGRSSRTFQPSYVNGK